MYKLSDHVLHCFPLMIYVIALKQESLSPSLIQDQYEREHIAEIIFILTESLRGTVTRIFGGFQRMVLTLRRWILLNCRTDLGQQPNLQWCL